MPTPFPRRTAAALAGVLRSTARRGRRRESRRRRSPTRVLRSTMDAAPSSCAPPPPSTAPSETPPPERQRTSDRPFLCSPPFLLLRFIRAVPRSVPDLLYSPETSMAAAFVRRRSQPRRRRSRRSPSALLLFSISDRHGLNRAGSTSSKPCWSPLFIPPRRRSLPPLAAAAYPADHLAVTPRRRRRPQLVSAPAHRDHPLPYRVSTMPVLLLSACAKLRSEIRAELHVRANPSQAKCRFNNRAEFDVVPITAPPEDKIKEVTEISSTREIGDGYESLKFKKG